MSSDQPLSKEKIIDSEVVTKHSDLGSQMVRAPRKSWQEFVLFILSMGVYSSFWSMSRAKDLKQGGHIQLTPWLWLFAPVFLLTGMLAYSNLFSNLEKVEKAQAIQRSNIFKNLWLLIFAVTSFVYAVFDRIPLPTWCLIVAIILSAINFCFLHRRFNQWKLNNADLSFYGKANGYAWYEWLLLLVVTPIMLFVSYQFVIKPVFLVDKTSYSDSFKIENDIHGFQFNIHGDGWAGVQTGTYSNEESLFEMSGPLEHSYVIVYDFGETYSVKNVTDFRYESVIDAYDKVECREQKRFTDNKLGEQAVMVCTSQDWSGYRTLVSSVFVYDGRTIEFVGEINRPKKFEKDYVVAQLRRMADSFQPLEIIDASQ